jgi:hypothetical protein
MHTIFVGGIATYRFAMGSNEPLGTPSPPAEYGTDSQESKTIIIDGPDKPFPAPPAGGKRKRGGLAEDELQAFTSMTEAIKDAAQVMTHKYRGCIVLLLINKSVKPNEEQKVLTSGFDQRIHCKY